MERCKLMNRIGIAKFEKVSFNQWKNDMLSGDFKEVYSRFPEIELKKMYDAIELPKRSTTGSVLQFPQELDVRWKKVGCSRFIREVDTALNTVFILQIPLELLMQITMVQITRDISM